LGLFWVVSKLIHKLDTVKIAPMSLETLDKILELVISIVKSNVGSGNQKPRYLFL
jgi:hypothetical protein